MKTFAAFSLTLLLVPAVHAFNPQPDPPGFGMVGIVRGQTARLNVVLQEPEVGDRHRVSDNRNVILQFVDSAGNVLNQMEARLQGSRAAHIDYRYVAPDVGDRETPPEVGDRRGIRAVIRFMDDPNLKTSARVLATLEVYDTASGETSFVLPGTDSGFGEVEGRPQR